MYLESLFSHKCSTSASNIDRSVFSKKKEQCEDVENSQKSTGKDQKASGTSKQDAELPFVEANWFMLSMAKSFGFHNVRRGSIGALEISPWRLVPMLIHLAISVAGLLVVLRLIFFCNLKYYQVVMISPIAFGLTFCIDAYIGTFSMGRHYIQYLTAIEAQDVKMKYFDNMSFVAAVTFVSSTIYTACSLLVTNLTQEYIFVLMIPVFTTTYLPTFMDMHMFSFNIMLKQQVIKLRHHIRGVNQWTRAEVSGVARQWLLLCKLFRLHNQVFRRSLHTRLLTFMVQVMAFSYAFFIIDFMLDELTTQASQAMVVVLSVLMPLAWTIARSLSLSFSGEIINHVYETVLDETRAVVVRGDHSPEGHPELRDLRRLLTRMESRPLALQVWGRDNLSAGIFVQNASLVLTYLVMVVQMQPMPNLNADFSIFVYEADNVQSLIMDKVRALSVP